MIQWMLNKLTNPNVAIRGALIAACLGILWIVLSFVLRFHILTDPNTDRQIGYLWSWNWSLVYTLLFPPIIYLVLMFFRLGPTIIENLIDYKMIINKRDLKIAESKHSLLDKYNQSVRFSLKIWLVLMSLSVLYSMTEWWHDSMIPLVKYSSLSEAQDRNIEIDWMIAHLIDNNINKYTNMAFTFSIFLLGQSLLISTGLLITVFSWNFCYFVFSLKDGALGYRVIPSLTSKDKRCGFELFEKYGVNLVILTLFIFIALYLVIVSNQFKNGNLDDTLSILDFLFRPYTSFSLFSLWTPIVTDPSTGAAIFGAFLILGMVFSFLFLVPALLARSSKEEIDTLFANKDFTNNISQKDMNAIAQTRDKMRIWPYNWMSFNQFIIILVIAFGGIIFYRLFPLLFIFFLWKIILAIKKELSEKASELKTR